MLTYVYVKKHNITGLKYFGKTQRADVSLYKGSGKYWQNHIRKYGYNVTTEIVLKSDDKEELRSFCLEFSKLNNVRESSEWANLQEENGLDGNPVGIVFTEEHRKKLSKNSAKNSPWKDKEMPEAMRKKMSDALKGNTKRVGKVLSEAHKRAIAESNKRRVRNKKLKEISQ